MLTPKCHVTFFRFNNPWFEYFWKRKVVTESKIMLYKTLSFFNISHFKANKFEKTAINIEKEIVTRGGGQKSVTYYLNGPLSET